MLLLTKKLGFSLSPRHRLNQQQSHHCTLLSMRTTMCMMLNGHRHILHCLPQWMEMASLIYGT